MPSDLHPMPAVPRAEPAPATPARPAPLVTATAAPPHAPAPWQAAPRPPRRCRLWRLAIGGLVMGLLTGGFLLLAALFAPPRGVEFVLLGAGYEQNLAVPHNVYGFHSLSDLASTLDEGARQSYWSRRFWRVPTQPQRLLTDTDLAEIAPQTSSRNWILFVAAHGGSDRAGAYLVADNDLTPSRGAQRLRIARLLEHLKTLPAQQHKVLVLDCVHLECDVTRGMLTNDFAVELAKLDREIAAIPNLVVVCASGADQLSWPCPMWGRSTFAHFWIEGMRGAATDVDADGRITLDELLAFTTAHTSHWVQQHYRAEQTPWLLPQGDEGRRRAARVDLAWKGAAYEPSTPTLNAPTEIPAALETAWRTAAELHARPLPPYVYQPQLWRRYLATLRRYEQLVLAGETHASERLAGEVQSLALACRHDPTQLLTSLDAQRSSSAFTQPASPQLRSQAEDVLQALVVLPAEKWPDAWKQTLAEAGPAAPSLRAELLQLLVEQAVSDPAERLARVQQLAGIIRDPLQPLCPALHLAVMIKRDLPADARTLEAAPTIAQALRLRQMAEQATTGDIRGFMQTSPRVKAWVAERVAQADALRREGEDLLLAGGDQHPLARERFTAAETLYRQAIADGSVVLEAYRTRDEALALLPDVSMAALSFSRECAAGHPSLTRLARQVEATWDDVQELTGLLLPCNQSGAACTPPAIDELVAATRRLSAQLRLVEQDIDALWRELATDKFSGERLCLTHIPTLPTMDVALRRQASQRLLQYVHHRREDLLQLLALTATGHVYEAAPPHQTATEIAAAVQATAQARGALALAMWGPAEFTAQTTVGADTWAEAQHRLEVFRVDPDWRSALTALGDQLAARWQQRMQRVDELVDASNAHDGQMRACVQADDEGRTLPATFFVDLDDRASDNLRRRRLSTYLAWQAERTWLDHWYGESDDETPYYAARARALLADAQRVSPQSNAFGDLARRIAASDDWQLETPDHLAATPEEAFGFTASLRPASETLTGYVRLGVEFGPGLNASQPLADAWAWPAQRGAIEVPIDGGAIDFPAFANQTLAASRVQVSAYYRGRSVRRDIDVELHSTPEFAFVEPPAPRTAMIAIETSPDLTQRFGRGQGAVAIVLDCSGSMGPKLGQPFDATTRYALATDALATVLAGLPRGANLSLWTFGQATGPQKTVKEAEKTIRCLRPLAPWDPADKAASAALVNSFRYPAVEPWNESAVVHAMLAAQEELAQYRGSKTLIVITDGIDNRFEHDRTANPRQFDVATGLAEAFRGSGVSINVVGFQIASHEDQAARQQFSVIETLDPPGKFFSVADSHDLLAALQNALDQQLRYWVEDFDHRTVPAQVAGGSEPALTAAALPRDRLSVTPGEYRLRVLADRPLERPLIVAGGDFLLAQLRAAGDGLALERGSVLARLYPQATLAPAAGWNVGVLKTALDSERATIDIAFERTASAQELQLAHVAPSQLWCQWTLPALDGRPAAVRATRTFESGLPAWRVECLLPSDAALPAAVSSSFEAWWLDNDLAQVRPQLQAGRDFQSLAELVGRTVNVDGQAIRIRDARWQTSPSGGQLVIVLEGATTAPVWLEVAGLAATAAEHRHYQSLARYAGRFDLPIDALPSAGWRLEFVSLARLQQLAEERGTHVRFDKLLLERAAPPDLPRP